MLFDRCSVFIELKLNSHGDFLRNNTTNYNQLTSSRPRGWGFWLWNS